MMSLYHAQQHENTLHTWPTVFTAMSASSDDAAKDDRAPSFAWGCPLGDDECPKAKQWLGGTKQSLWSEERCRQAVLDHLMCSPYHNEVHLTMADHLMCSTEMTMKKTTGKAKTAMKAKKHMKAKNPMKMMKVVKAMKVMKAKNHMNTMKAVKVMKAKNPMNAAESSTQRS